MVGFREVSILALLEQRFDLRVQRIQRLHVRRELLGHTGIARLICGVLQRLQFLAGGSRQALKRFRPVRNDFIRFLLPVRPDLEKPVQPVHGGLLIAGEVLLTHAEERQPFALAIEGFGGGVLPLLRGLIHAFQRFPRLLRAGNIVHQGDRTRHHRRGDRQPDGRRLGEYRKESRPAAARLAHRRGELPNARGQRAHALGDLAHEQQHWPDRCRNGRVADDLHPLGFVHFEELVQQLARAVDETLDHGIEVVPDLLAEQHSLVLEVDQPAFRGGIALAGFFGQRGVLFPRGIGQRLRPGEQLRGVGGAQQRVAQPDFIDPDLIQRGDGRRAFLVHFGQTHDECLKR